MKFAEGKWTKSPPTKDGVYFIADKLGRFYNTPRMVLFVDGRGTVRPEGTALESYGDVWWWSENLDLPNPPGWYDESK